MQISPRRISTRKRASVADAASAYLAGEFEHCLTLCLEIRVGSLATRSEVALLTARSYLRIGRPDRAQAVIVDSMQTHGTLDAALTAQTLLAAARIQQNDTQSGIAILTEAAADSADAHLDVRSEITFFTALAYWTKRDIESAETFLSLIDPRSERIRASALDLQARCHSARHDYRRSAESYQAALLELDRSAVPDRALGATAIRHLAIFAAELFDRDLARCAERRAQRFDWSGQFGIDQADTLAHLAIFSEFAGETIAAYEFAEQAREVAPSTPYAILAFGLSSTLAQNAGEPCSAMVFAQRAQELFKTLGVDESSGEFHFALLAYAEYCAQSDPDRASDILARYWNSAPLDELAVRSKDPRIAANEAFVQGAIAYACGELERAETLYRAALHTFADIGYVRRALIAAHELFKITGDADLHCYVMAQLGDTGNYVSASLGALETSGTASKLHTVLAALPDNQREVVALICLGKTNKEVAQLRNVGEQTIKNMLTEHVFPAFGVSSRAALVSSCLRALINNGRPARSDGFLAALNLALRPAGSAQEGTRC